MTRLLLVRHGETDWNRQNRHQGQKDIPLNALGRDQVDRAVQHLANEQIDAAYASDLCRAWETATAIAAQHERLAIIKEPRLREMHFGEWEGLTWAQIHQREPSAVENWSQILMENGPPGGENLSQFGVRVKETADEIIKGHPDKSVLLVAHGGTLMMLICLLLEYPIKNYWKFRIEKASLSEIEAYPEGAIINHLNDTSHLKDLLPCG
jgi:alpha-ribazole phosphatase